MIHRLKRDIVCNITNNYTLYYNNDLYRFDHFLQETKIFTSLKICDLSETSKLIIRIGKPEKMIDTQWIFSTLPTELNIDDLVIDRLFAWSCRANPTNASRQLEPRG